MARPLGTLAFAALALTLLGASTHAGGPSPSAAAAGDRDCSDFASQRAAQNYFLSKGGPGRDPDHLDADGDGIACESNPCPCKYPGGAGGGGPKPQRIKARVLRVIDGDTLRVRARGAGRQRYDVRLIGIDTPEKYGRRECGSARASRAMRRRAPRGLRVRLVTDPTQDLFDRYGRLLAYVERRRNGSDLGRAQLVHGWARVYVFERPFRRLRPYQRAARRARRAARGVWALCQGRFHQPLQRPTARRQ
jgi:endonuclease YncB( thermonuclease family)